MEKDDAEAERRIAEAERRIAEAKASGERKLNLCGVVIEQLPKSLGTLTGLQYQLFGCNQRMALRQLSLRRNRRLTDVSVLSALTGLQQLDLSECSELKDVSALSNLTSLQQLDLSGCSELKDVSALSNLTSLQQLNLRECRELKDVSALSNLTSLQQLNLSGCSELKDVSALSNLTSLQQLDLSGCSELKDVSALSNLTSLQQLNLSECSELKDVSVLSNLTSLQQLNLRGCSELKDVSALSNLTSLQQLNLRGCSELKDVSALSNLTSLQQLDLSGCGELKDVSALSNLTSLQQLSVQGSAALPVGTQDLPLTWWPELRFLNATRLIGAPVGLSLYGDNCLPRIKAWHRDLEAGVAPNADLKLFVLGNGRIGKTQICRRLKGEGFDASIPSTHGVSLGQVRLLEGDEAAEPPEPPVDLRFWDFGGQDVYLGTHALFLDDRAVYVIAWTPSHENTDEFEENGVPMRNRPLRYWLDYVRSLAGPEAPVIVVQTQCDRESQVSPAPIPPDHGFPRLRIADCSAKRGDGMARLMLELKSAARYQLEQYDAVELPANWVAVGDDLRRMRDEQGIRTLPRSDFERLCLEQHQTAAPGVVLEYLHRSGQVFWKAGVFGDQVVLDQAWALDGIYAVLNRNSALPLLRLQHGRFTPELLAMLVWQSRSEAERGLFLSMMGTCQTCFRIDAGTYIAPALLPLEDVMAASIHTVWPGVQAGAEARLDYAFLHEGVLRAMLCRIGSHAGLQAVYWRYGVCFYDQAAAGVVRIRSTLPDPSGQGGGGWMSVETTGANAAALAQDVVRSIERINIGEKPKVTWMISEPSETRNESADESGQEPFARLNPGPVPRAAGAPIPVYVSYAWEQTSQAFVDEVGRRLPPDRFEFRRDMTHLKPGDWISRFMAEIGRADCVLVVLSDKYLRSPNCMRELLHLYQRSQGDRADLMDRIVAVVLPELKIDRAFGRLTYVRHWNDEYKQLDEAYRELGLTAMGAADREEWLAIQDFRHRVSDIMAWVSDVLMPRGEGSLDAAIARIEARASA